MSIGRLGLIGGTDSKRTSGLYSSQENVAETDAQRYITRYGYDNIFNALASSGTEEGFDVSRDGVYLYAAVRGTRTTAIIYQYQMSTPWNLSTISYSNKSLVVGDYEVNCNCLSINDDGTKLFFSGTTGDVVWSVTLATPYDLATAVFDVKKAYVGTQDATANTPFIGDNGTKMYVLGATNRVVYQYTLSTPYDVSTATYANKSLSVNTQDTAAQGIFFKDDGTKMYMVGNTSYATYSYTLSTPWDVSTGVSDYAIKTYNTTTQASTPRGTFIGDNGTKMYVLNATAGILSVFQYTLSVAYDVSTATYASKTISVSPRDTDPWGLFFKSDGTKMYMLGSTNDAVFSYTLSTPWDLATAVADYTPRSFSVNTQAAEPYNAYIGDNGTKMYVLNQTTNAVFQYTLSTPYLVTSATYASKTLAIARDTDCRGLFFRDNGTKMYILGNTSDTIYAYTLSTPWDVATGTSDYIPKSFNVTTQAAEPYSTYIGDSGTKMYVLNQATDAVFQYTLSTPYNVSTAVYANKTISVTTQEADPRGMYFKSDGTKMYIIGVTNNAVFSYTLSTPWDIATATADFLVKSYVVSTQTTNPSDFFIGDNGTKMYVLAGGPATTDTVFQYTLSTAWDVTSAIYASKSFSVNTQSTSSESIFFKGDGTKMYILNDGNDSIFQYSLSVAWDISTCTYDNISFSVTGQETFPTGLYFSPDGLNMYVGGQVGDDINQYALSTPWAVNTATFVRASTVIGDATQYGIYFKSDGTKMYLIGSTNSNIFEYSLSTPWNVSTLSLSRTLIYNAAFFSGIPTGIYFKDDGTKVYISNLTINRVTELSLGVPWQITSVVGRFSAVAEDTACNALYISPDGLRMYIAGQTGDDVNQYDLSVAWDTSSATFARVSVTHTEATVTGLFFQSDGSRMYISGQTLDTVREYTLSTPWDVSTITLATSFSTANFDATTNGIFFSPTGTEMYITGGTNNTIYQLTLSQAWRSSFINGYFLVTLEETVPTSMYISPDGLNLYVTGQTGDDVNQYLLGTAWDISTAAYVRVSATHGEATATGIFFKEDGTRMYITGSTNDTVREFTLSTPWNVSTLTFLRSVYIGNFDLTNNGIFISPDGLNMYLTGGTNNTIYQLELSQAWKSSYIKGFFPAATEDSGTTAMYISPDGLNMYISGNGGDDVNQYLLDVAWDISTAVYVRVSVTHGETEPRGIFFNDTGTKMFIAGQTDDRVREYNLATPWNVSSITANSFFYYGHIIAASTSLYFSPDGTKMYLTGNTLVYQFNLDTAWKSNGVTGMYSIVTEDLAPRAIYLRPDGTSMYLIGQTGDDVNQYTLSTAWNISTASYTAVSAASGEATPAGVFFRPDGTKMYVIGNTNDAVREFNLSTPWSVTSASFSKTISVGFESLPTGIFFKDDGLQMYISGHTNDCVYQITLGSAWDVGTAKGYVYIGATEAAVRGIQVADNGNLLYVSGDSNSIRKYTMTAPHDIGTATLSQSFTISGPYGIDVSSDGRTIYATLQSTSSVAPGGGRMIRSISMTAPHDLSTAALSTTEWMPLYGLTGANTTPFAIRVSKDRTRMFLLSDVVSGIYQFSLRFA